MVDCTIQHLIDCDAAPLNPLAGGGWMVEEHRKGGPFEWNPSHVTLYVDKRQKQWPWLQGNELRKELSGKPVLNATVLDYLLAHPELIPEDWKSKLVFFWGTVYRNSDARLCVRSLYWGGHWWFSDYYGLDLNWLDGDPPPSAHVDLGARSLGSFGSVGLSSSGDPHLSQTAGAGLRFDTTRE